VARLNIAMVQFLRVAPGPAPAEWPIWVYSLDLLSRLVLRWRDSPLGPFIERPASDAPGDDEDDPSRLMTPGQRALVVLYRACRRLASPREVDRMTLAQVAALIGVGEPSAAGEERRSKGRYRRETKRNGNLVHSVDVRAPGTPERYRGMRPVPLPARAA
jgi:hypothetical protein